MVVLFLWVSRPRPRLGCCFPVFQSNWLFAWPCSLHLTTSTVNEPWWWYVGFSVTFGPFLSSLKQIVFLECADGKYGQNCSLSCSTSCTSTCNKVNGHCTCQPGYQPSTCHQGNLPFSLCLSSTDAKWTFWNETERIKKKVINDNTNDKHQEEQKHRRQEQQQR